MIAVRKQRRHSVTMREGFEWSAVVWHPAVPADHLTCSYCRSELLLCEMTTLIWAEDGSVAELCESCADEWVGEDP